MNGKSLGPVGPSADLVPSSPGYRDLLSNRRYVLYQISANTSYAGYAVYAISIPWLTFRLTGSLLLVGVVFFAEFGVYALTFVVAPWVDRARNKRTIFLACYPAQAFAAATIGFAFAFGVLTVPVLLALVVFISVLWDFAWAATNVVPRLLLTPDQLFRSGGFSGVLGGATQLVGYSAGAAIIVLATSAGGLFVYAGLLTVASVAAAAVSLPVDVPRAEGHYAREFREGWKVFSPSATTSLLPLGGVELVRGFFTAAPALLITLTASQVFVGSSSSYGVLYTAWVLGGVGVGLVLGELNPRGRVGRALFVGTLVEGLAVLGATHFAPQLWVGAALWSFAGAASTTYITAPYSFLLGGFPPDRIGRVTSNLYVFTGTSAAAGSLVFGTLALTRSPSELGVVVAIGYMVVSGLLLAIPSIRRMAF